MFPTQYGSQTPHVQLPRVRVVMSNFVHPSLTSSILIIVMSQPTPMHNFEITLPKNELGELQNLQTPSIRSQMSHVGFTTHGILLNPLACSVLIHPFPNAFIALKLTLFDRKRDPYHHI